MFRFSDYFVYLAEKRMEFWKHVEYNACPTEEWICVKYQQIYTYDVNIEQQSNAETNEMDIKISEDKVEEVTSLFYLVAT